MTISLQEQCQLSGNAQTAVQRIEENPQQKSEENANKASNRSIS